jgi:glycosyltransferase involved in cell wall biosynthesis
METPIVATDVGGTTELMRSGVDGLAVPAQDAAALAAGIRQVLADPEGSRARAASARRRVEESLSFAARVERMNGIYESLAAGRRAGDRRRRAGASS